MSIKPLNLSRSGNERLVGVFGVRMQLGNEVIELTDYLTPAGRPIPIDSRSNDRWFQHIAIVVSDMNQAYQLLRQHNVQHVSTAPQRLPEYLINAAGIEAFYFRDPDGHNLEIIYYPPDKGERNFRWRCSVFLTEMYCSGVDGGRGAACLGYQMNLILLVLLNCFQWNQ